MSNFEIDFSKVKKEENNYGPIPAGEYILVIERAAIKESQTPGNFYINLMLKVKGKEYTNRVVWDIINFRNSNEVAQQIGQSRLKSLMISTGVEEDKLKSANMDSIVEHLKNKAVITQVRIEKREGYEARNVIQEYVEPMNEVRKGIEKQKEELPSWM